MCGIIGFSSFKGQKFNVDKIKILYMYNLSRGEDATGLWTPKNGVIKTLEKASKFLTGDKFKNIEPDCSFIGHVRAGFKYKHSLSSAHPHEGTTCVLAHNGTLTNTYALSSKYDLIDNGTDTELLHKILDKNFTPKILSEIDGTASLLYADKNIKLKRGQENSYLLVFRLNKERPLFYGMSEEGMYISSLDESLEAIGCTDITEFDTNILYSIFEAKIIAQHDIPSRPAKYVYTPNTTPSTNHVYHGANNLASFTNNADMSWWDKYLENWIQVDTKSPMYNCPISYNIDEWFLLKSIDVPNRKLNVQNIESKLLEIPVTHFRYNQKVKPLNPYSLEKVVVMTNITSSSLLENGKSKIIFYIGDVVSITQSETVSDGDICVTCKSHVTGQYHLFNRAFVRPPLDTELPYTNIVDNAKHLKLSVTNNTSKPNQTEDLPSSKIEESFLAQYIVENSINLNKISIQELINTTDLSKEVSSIFDICEEAFITIDDILSTIVNEEDALDLVTKTSLGNDLGELKDKICDVYLKSVELWKKKQLETA